MPYCPNCSCPLEVSENECPLCRATFGENSSWAPTAEPSGPVPRRPDPRSAVQAAGEQDEGNPRMRRWIAVVACGFAAIVGWIAFVMYPDYVERTRNPQIRGKLLEELQAKYQPNNVTFSSQSCKEPLGPDARTGVVRQAWRADGAFEVDGNVTAYCGMAIPVGSYAVEGAKLRLEYVVLVGNVNPPKCHCLYDVKYAISGLEKRDYEIEFVEVQR